VVDLRRIRDRSVRGMRIWQVAVLDDSYDYLSARYARNVGAGPLAALPLFRFLAGLQTAATLSHTYEFISHTTVGLYVLTRLPYWRSWVEVLRANAYACTRGYRLTHYVVAITCIFRGSRIAFANSRIHTHNVNRSALSMLRSLLDCRLETKRE